MHVDTDRVTVLLYIILKHFKIQSEEALFPVICEIWYDDTIQKNPHQVVHESILLNEDWFPTGFCIILE